MSPSSSRWKPPIFIHKTSLPPHLSFVVAEPQQTPSLNSAADKLPNILRRAMPPDRDPSQSDSIPMDVDMSPIAEDSPESPPVNVVDESNQPVSGAIMPLFRHDAQLIIPTPATSPPLTLDHVSVTPHDDQSSPPVNPLTTPAVDSQDPVPPPSLSNKRSWFDVFYWSSDKETSISEVKVEVDSALNAPDTVHICTESSDISRQHAALETIEPAESTGDVQSLPKDPVSRIPHSPSNRVDAPSVPEEQPVSHSPPSPLPLHSPLPRAQEGTSPPVAPNTATSIFALNFPMLAKSKPPPEIAVTPRDPFPETSDEPTVATPGMDALVML